MATPESAARLHVLVSTGFGLGRAPFAPGTVGSLAGLALGWLLGVAGGSWLVLVGTCFVALLGTWAANGAEQLLGRKDPPCIVVDEIAGQMVSLLFLPISVPSLLSGFVLFRLLDITKPFPIRRLERLPGGTGIMADDLLAGAYANLLHRAVGVLLPHPWTLS